MPDDIEISTRAESEANVANTAAVVAPNTTTTTTTATTAATAAAAVAAKTDLANNSNTQIANGENNGNAPAAVQQQQQQQQQQSQQVQQTPTITTTTTTTTTTSNDGKMDADAALTNFKVLYVVAQLCGFTMIVLVGSWVGMHMGGLGGTSNPKLEFNWHPLLMTIGLIFLYGNSILIYRGFRTTRKKTLKITHASIHILAFILTVIALITVFDSHNLANPPIPNMYSLHSWLGLGAVLLFCLQYVAGFMAYMVPGLRESYKIAYMPLHIYFGLFGFVLAIASALMGLTEKAIYAIPDYTLMANAGVMTNLIGLLYVVFGGLVVYLCTEPSYKRKSIPEDTVLLTGMNE